MAVVAKFSVGSVEQFTYGSTVRLQAIMPADSDDKITRDENTRFWEATPNGRFEMTVNNPAAAEQFQPGDQWYLTFERAPKPE